MAIPEAESDFISLRGIRDQTHKIEDTKKKLRWFLREKPFLSACDSCNGRTYGDPEITPVFKQRHLLSTLSLIGFKYAY